MDNPRSPEAQRAAIETITKPGTKPAEPELTFPNFARRPLKPAVFDDRQMATPEGRAKAFKAYHAAETALEPMMTATKDAYDDFKRFTGIDLRELSNPPMTATEVLERQRAHDAKIDRVNDGVVSELVVAMTELALVSEVLQSLPDEEFVQFIASVVRKRGDKAAEKLWPIIMRMTP